MSRRASCLAIGSALIGSAGRSSAQSPAACSELRRSEILGDQPDVLERRPRPARRRSARSSSQLRKRRPGHRVLRRRHAIGVGDGGTAAGSRTERMAGARALHDGGVRRIVGGRAVHLLARDTARPISSATPKALDPKTIETVPVWSAGRAHRQLGPRSCRCASRRPASCRTRSAVAIWCRRGGYCRWRAPGSARFRKRDIPEPNRQNKTYAHMLGQIFLSGVVDGLESQAVRVGRSQRRST